MFAVTVINPAARRLICIICTVDRSTRREHSDLGADSRRWSLTFLRLNSLIDDKSKFVSTYFFDSRARRPTGVSWKISRDLFRFGILCANTVDSRGIRTCRGNPSRPILSRDLFGSHWANHLQVALRCTTVRVYRVARDRRVIIFHVHKRQPGARETVCDPGRFSLSK